MTSDENGTDAFDQADDQAGPAQAPWWHSSPAEPPVDSVMVEGLKLASALRDWAVESGAVAAVADLTQAAATTATAYLAQPTEESISDETEAAMPDAHAAEPVVRCSDCPVCQGLDALERSNPEWAHTARAAMSQVNALVGGLFAAMGGDGRANT
ncbi:MAG: hypothetical protein R2686_06640 [Candidatus Nanopelagicales bacterium]